VIHLGIFARIFVSFDSDFEYGVLSLIHTQASYKLNPITEKDFLGAWGSAIMQRTKLETHINFDRNSDTQSALTETTIADEANFLNQKVLKQLEVFTQNCLVKHLSYRTMDVSIIEKRGHLALTCLEKPSYPLNRHPTRPSGDMGGNRAWICELTSTMSSTGYEKR